MYQRNAFEPTTYSDTVKRNNLTCEIDSEDENSIPTPIKTSSNKKSVLVTVGTTKFDELISQFNQYAFQLKLKELGYENIVLQIGNGIIEPQPYQSLDLKCEWFRFRITGLWDLMNDSELIICHAGAGTSLEACGRSGSYSNSTKKVIVVVNAQLMNNHQTELARKLADLNSCIYCKSPSMLLELMSRHSSRLACQADGGFVRFNSRYYSNVADRMQKMVVPTPNTGKSKKAFLCKLAIYIILFILIFIVVSTLIGY